MIPEVIYLHYLSALLEGDKKQCMQIVSDLVDKNECIKDIYLNLFQRSMYRIGQMWEKEKCSVAEEHIATKITECLVEFTTQKFASRSRNGRQIILTCIDKEYHELGARMVAGFFEANGWDALFLGSSTPTNELLRLIELKKPDLFGISINFYINVSRLVKLINSIESRFPEQKILVGGQALAEERAHVLDKFQNVKYICSLDELDRYIRE